MNSTDTDEITAYVEAVRAALVGLPDVTRDELTEDLPEHLAEVLADGVGSLTERLGPPELYAAELRASAGFVGGFPDPPPVTDPLRRVREAALRRLRVADVRVGPFLGYSRVSEFLVLLRPAWWVLRGYLAAMVVAWMLDDSGQPMGLLPRIGGSDAVALLLLVAGVFASIWFGRRMTRLDRLPRYALYAGSAVLVLVAFGGFLNADSSARGSDYADVGYSDPYGHVQDVFVYDDQGRLIDGARLFDQDGQPIRLGSPYCYTDDGGMTDSGPARDESRYPYCPANAPFRVPVPSEPSATASAEPSDGASVGPSVRPSVSSSVRPSPTR